MKKVALPLATVALLAASTSYSHDQELDMKFDQTREIRPSAKVMANMITRAEGDEEEIGGTQPQTYNGTYAVTAFKWDDAGNEVTEGTHFYNEECRSGEFKTGSKYFPSDNRKLDFYAYAPVSGSYNSETHKINWTLTGLQDIVWAEGGTHHKNSGSNPEFAFAHKLAYLTINVAQGTGFQKDIEVVSIEILDVQTDATLDLRAGEMAYGATKENLAVPVNKGFKIGASAAYGTIMLPADVASYKVLTKTKNADGTDMIYDTVELKFKGQKADGSPKVFEEGVNYEVTLTFQGTEIENTNVTINEWTPADEGIDSLVK